ncbi:Capsid protein 1 [uncultured virus]|nr:Capsid protein 1 [uncultured virus]
MGGGLMDLSAKGIQDRYMTHKPEITFFKSSYKKHTNFAIESLDLQPSGHVGFGKRGQFDIQRAGDLVTNMVMRLRFPEVVHHGNNADNVQFAWVRRPGEAALTTIVVDIGSTMVDTQYGDWIRIWADLTLKAGHEQSYKRMIGDTPEMTDLSVLNPDGQNRTLKPATDVYIPFQFYFCKYNHLAIPLIALQFHSVKITFALRPIREMYIATDAFNPGSMDVVDASLFVDYIFLDDEERAEFINNPHEYLIEQVQHSEESVQTMKFRMMFSHPIKAMYWFLRNNMFQGKKFMSYDPVDWNKARKQAAKKIILSALNLDDRGYFVDSDISDLNYEPINFDGNGNEHDDNYYLFSNEDARRYATSSPNKLSKLKWNMPLLRLDQPNDRYGNTNSYNNQYQYGNANGTNSASNDLKHKVRGIVRICYHKPTNSLYPIVEKVTFNGLTIADLSVPLHLYNIDNRNRFVKNDDVTVWQHHNYGMFIDGSGNPFGDVDVIMNGNQRQSARPASWYNDVVPYAHHSKADKVGLHVFSFALNPEQWEPSCTSNFSRMDSVILHPQWNPQYDRYRKLFFTDPQNAKVYIFVLGYNIFRIKSGISGIAFNS